MLRERRWAGEALLRCCQGTCRTIKQQQQQQEQQH
jgi:hypothetical protein